MSMIGFPLLLIPLAVCNIIVFLMPGVSLAEPVVKLTLMSGAEWPLTLSDMLLALGILLLLFEVIKGARPGAKYFMDHLLSLVVFAGAAAEFVMLPQFGTSTYFLLIMLALVDFMSGVALRARRRLAPAAAPVSRNKRQRDIETQGPRLDPEPAPPVPPAATVAESVLLEPTTPHPVEIVRTSPEMRSPELQPGAHPSPDSPPR